MLRSLLSSLLGLNTKEIAEEPAPPPCQEMSATPKAPTKPNKPARAKRTKKTGYSKGSRVLGVTVSDYSTQNDDTEIDKFVKRIHGLIKSPVIAVNISGLTGDPNKRNHRCFKEMEKQPLLRSPHPKRYLVRFRLPYDANDQWGINFMFPEGGVFELSGYKARLKTASERIRTTFQPVIADSNVRAGVAYSRGKEQYISFGVELPITAHDLLTHCPNCLTEFGQQNLQSISKIFQARAEVEKIDLLNLYHDRAMLDRLCRRSEDEFRAAQDISKVGEGWINQTALFNLVKSKFPDAKKEYSPSWLGRQRIDIYIPQERLAIEYHGQQHYEPVEFFGGKEAFQKNVSRDQTKLALCEANNVSLIVWPYTRPVDKNELSSFLSEHGIVS